MHALAFECVEISGERGDESLAFAGDHFGDIAAVQDDPAEDLHVEVPHVLGAEGGLAAGGKCLGQEVVERFTVGEPLAEFRRQGPKFFRALRVHRRFELIDLREQRARRGGVRLLILGADVAELANRVFVRRAHHAREQADEPFRDAREPVAEPQEAPERGSIPE